MQRVAVFCGSKLGDSPIYRRTAVAVAQTLAARGAGLVYGGGRVGLMGVLADAARAAGAEVIGIIPKFMVREEVAHPDLTRLEIVDSMHLRKARMAELADAFLALPGGYGTLDELFEIVTWAQLGLHGKPIGLLDVNGYYSSIIQWLDGAIRDGFIALKHRHLLLTETDVDKLLDLLLRTSTDPGTSTLVIAAHTR